MAVDLRLQLVTMLPRMRRFARALSGASDRADDLVQSACERALRGAESFEAGTRLDSWLFRIIQNLWIDERRKVATRGVETAIDDDAAHEATDGARVMEARLAATSVLAAMARLPDDQRAVLALVCVEDLSYREAAEALSIPVGTVMSRLARARKALAAEMGLDATATAGGAE